MKKLYSIFTILCLSLLIASCSSELDEMHQVGYLKLEMQTLVSTHTRAVTNVPNDYNAKTLAVKVTDSNGKVVAQTNDFDNDPEIKKNLELTPGEYTITASSAGWDGSGSGFNAPYYAGSTKATVSAKTLTKAQLTLTQANVKVTVNFADNMSTYFTSASCIVSSATIGVAAQAFDFKTNNGSAYFPVANLKFFLNLTNKAGISHSMEKTVEDVKPRDHYIINYKIADAGSLGGVTVKVDDATQEYSFDIEIPRKAGTALEVKKANAWSTFAELSGEVTSKTQSFDASLLKMQWKKEGDANWHDIPATAITVDGDKYTCRLTDLTPNSNYLYRMYYAETENPVNSNEMAFTTETQTGIENASFDNWYKNGNVWSPNAQGASYWDSSNSGSAGVMGEKYNVTTGITDGAYSGTSAQLQSMYVVIKFAAASLFTGKMDGMIGTNGAKLSWGVPFTSRPTALKGFMKYTTGAINRGSQPSGAPASGQNDACQIFCALLTDQLKVANASNNDGYEMSTTFDWINDPRVIAYGEMTQNTSDAAWKSFNIPLKYYSLTTKPKYMLIVCSSSKWGDYFYGCDNAKLLLDDFSFEYGEPTVK